MRHIQFCIEELLAEIDSELADQACVRALAQLDERDARGETLVAVDGPKLRQRINKQIEALPLVAARAKVLELRAVLRTDSPTAATVSATPVANVPEADAAPASVPEPARHVIPVGTTIRRRPVWQKPMHERLAEAAAAATGAAVIVIGLWLTPVLSLAGGPFAPLARTLPPSVSWLDWTGNGLRAGTITSAGQPEHAHE